MIIKKGTTLIEVLVSSIILVIVVGAILYTYTVYQRIIIKNSLTQEAVSVIDNNFERINSLVESGTNSILLLQTAIDGFNIANEKFMIDSNVTYSLTFTTAPLIVYPKGEGLKFNQEILDVQANISWTYLGTTEDVDMQFLTKAELRD